MIKNQHSFLMSERETAAATIMHMYTALCDTGAVVRLKAPARYIKNNKRVYAGAIDDKTLCKFNVILEMQPDTLARIREHDPEQFDRSGITDLIAVLNKILDTPAPEADN